MSQKEENTVYYVNFPQPPSANRMWRTVGALKGAHIYKSKLYLAFCKQVWLSCKEANIKPLKCDVNVEILWFRKRKQGDADNRIKPVLDALQGYAYEDDKQVKRVSIQICDGSERKGTMEVKITPSQDQSTS